MAGGRFGYGHLGRCLPLYNEAQQQGISAKIVVINGGDEPIITDVDLDESDWITNTEALEISHDDIVVIDVLDVSIDVLRSIQSRAKDMFIIDDVNVDKYQQFKRIDWSIKTHVLSNSQNHALSSPSLVPLKSAFSRFKKKKVKEELATVLITLGGSDIRNLSPLLIAFFNEYYPLLNVIVLVGPGFQCVQEIKEISGENVTLLESPSASEISDAMEKSDLAIATGGHTMYELAAAGLSTVQLQVIENQEVSKYWAEYGFSYFAGWYTEKDFLEKMKLGIEHFSCQSVRSHSSNLGQSIIDGCGAKNLISELVREYVGQR
jgi:spore coat polysaccharide biosynthesis predicted glycosyltransferase SpsG